MITAHGLEMACGRDVGGDHRFFDQPVSIVALHGIDAHGPPAFEPEGGFVGVEVQRAALVALGSERFVDVVKGPHGLGHVGGRVNVPWCRKSCTAS